MNQLEAIMFALDWKQKGHEPGGKLYKTNFAEHIYFARTGHPPPLKTNSKVDKQDFKTFKKRHQKLVTSHNFLLELYRKVLVPRPLPQMNLMLFYTVWCCHPIRPHMGGWQLGKMHPRLSAPCSRSCRTSTPPLSMTIASPMYQYSSRLLMCWPTTTPLTISSGWCQSPFLDNACTPAPWAWKPNWPLSHELNSDIIFTFGPMNSLLSPRYHWPFCP